MKSRYFAGLFFVFLLMSCSVDHKPVFNGKDLTGWQQYGSGKWYVQDGNLVCESVEGKEGYLTTERNYDNFDLSFEFKEEQLEGEFGVFFHTNVATSDVYGWKVVIAPLNHGTGSIYEQNGRGWLEHIPEQNEKMLKSNGWNRMRVKVEHGHVITWLNGYLMVDYSDSKIATGKGGITFQVKGKEVKVKLRNIRVKELDELEKVNQYI